MKTFKDLIFNQHELSDSGIPMFENAKQAVEKFNNGYSVSVLFGNCFYSNGKNTYEVAILYEDEITYNTEITNDVIAHATQEEVSEIMKKIQTLKY